MKGPLFLQIYRTFTIVFAPAAPLFLFWREKNGLEDKARKPERLGLTQQMPLPRPLAWLHGASLGESLSLLPLIEKLAGRGFHILLTTGTVTSANVMARRLPAHALHQYVPLDVPRFMARFLDHWQPDIAFLAESELWPNLLIETHERKIPLVLVNARMSERSFRRWQQLPRFAEALLTKTDLCLAQSATDAERFQHLGARHVHIGGNLKFDVAPPPADAQKLAEWQARLGGRPVWLAAATHPGEEEIVFATHKALLGIHPHLLTIVAPRHPRRRDEIVEAAKAQGLACRLRSQDGDQPPPVEGLYIADSVGEMGLFYRLAEIAFIGKSLSAKSLTVSGGQSPLEAAKLGCAILHGPDVGNFADIYQHLDASGGAVEVEDADALAQTIAELLADKMGLRDMARAASRLVASLSGATDYIMQAIEPHILQLQVGQRPDV